MIPEIIRGQISVQADVSGSSTGHGKQTVSNCPVEKSQGLISGRCMLLLLLLFFLFFNKTICLLSAQYAAIKFFTIWGLIIGLGRSDKMDK